MLKQISLMALCVYLLGAGRQADPIMQPATAPAVANSTASGIETIVILRHAEKPSGGFGQLTPQGFNRAIALSSVLPKKFGKPDFLFAPDPGEKKADSIALFCYCRPLATIEPTAIKLEMPVQASLGYRDIDKLEDELNKPAYSNALVFVAWEHHYGQKLATAFMGTYGGDPAAVPAWSGNDFDSLYVIKIKRAIGKNPTVSFSHDNEGLNGQSKEMPSPAAG